LFNLFVIKKINVEDDSKSDWITVQYDGDFRAAPDILFTEKSASYVGGIFESYKQKISKTPHYMTQEELQQLQDFCFVMAMGTLAKHFKVKEFDWPSFNDNNDNDIPKLLTSSSDKEDIFSSSEIALSSGFDSVTFASVIEGVDKIVDIIPKLTQALKTTKSETVKTFTRHGFEKFSQKTQIRILSGFKNEKIEDLVNHLMKKSLNKFST